MTKDERGYQFAYDAWNSLVQVKDATGNVVATYKNDALGRRIQQTSSGTTTDLYFNSSWQVVEERVSGAAKVQYVWAPTGGDVLVERDRDTAGDGTWAERFYAMQDTNNNVLAMANALGAGAVSERYAYDPYGSVTFWTATWGTLSASAYAVTYLFQAGRYDTATGLYNFRHRDLSPTLGRWLVNDPLGFGGGDVNTYRYVKNQPTVSTDASGMGPIHAAPLGHIDPPPEIDGVRSELPPFIRINPRPQQIDNLPQMDYANLLPPISLTPQPGPVLADEIPTENALWSRLFGRAITSYSDLTQDERDAYLRYVDEANRRVVRVQRTMPFWSTLYREDRVLYWLNTVTRIFTPDSEPSTIIYYSDGSRLVNLGGGPSSGDLLGAMLAYCSVYGLFTSPAPLGQIHHPISTRVAAALERHPTLRGLYQARDPRFVTRAVDEAAHRGYQAWHRALDAEVVEWLGANQAATRAQFEAWLRWRYSQPDLLARFPDGF